MPVQDVENIEFSIHAVEQHDVFSNAQGMQIFYRHLLPKDVALRATLLIAHGYAEHSARYINVIQTLLPLGIEIFVLDHQGHGHSEGKRGHVERLQNFVDDMHQLYTEKIAPSLAGRGLFLLGHSMGSIIAMHYASQHAAELKGLILSGTGNSMAGTPKLLTALAKVISAIAPKLPIKSPFPNDFISHDEQVVRAYTNDPLIFAPHLTARLGAEMYQACLDGAQQLVKLKLPLLIVYGSEDTSFSGQQVLFDAYLGADKSIQSYQGARHEVFNELPQWKDMALADLKTWFEQHLG